MTIPDTKAEKHPMLSDGFGRATAEYQRILRQIENREVTITFKRQQELERMATCEHWFESKLPDGYLQCRCGAKYKPKPTAWERFWSRVKLWLWYN